MSEEKIFTIPIKINLSDYDQDCSNSDSSCSYWSIQPGRRDGSFMSQACVILAGDSSFHPDKSGLLFFGSFLLEDQKI